MANDQVWAVSEGAYSDYRILFVAPSEAEAEAWCKICNEQGSYQERFVESFPLLVAPPVPVTVYRRTWSVYAPEGKLTESNQEFERTKFDFEVWDMKRRPKIEYQKWSGARPFPNGIQVEGLDKVAVDKVVTDFVARQRALGWLFDPANWEQPSASYRHWIPVAGAPDESVLGIPSEYMPDVGT